MNLIICLLSCLFWSIHAFNWSPDPQPDTFTPQSDMNFTLTKQMKKLVYAPDQSSISYLTSTGTLVFRSSLLQSITSTTISIQSGIRNLAYSPTSDRLYLTVKTFKNLTNLYRINIEKGELQQNTIHLMAPLADSSIKSAFMAVTSDKIAVFDSPSFVLYVFNITDESNVTMQGRYYFTDGRILYDACWHPVEKENLLMSILKSSYSLISFYNATANETRDLLNTTNMKYFVGIVRNGTAFVYSTTAGSVMVYSYLDGVVKLEDFVDFVYLERNCIPLHPQADVFPVFDADVSKNLTRFYRIVEKQERYGKGFSWNPLRSRTSPKEPTKTLQLKLIYSSNLTFSGISPDSNQIYLASKDKTTKQTSIKRFRRCIDGSFPSLGQCLPCSPLCPTCHLTPTQCTSCTSPLVLSTYTCIECNIKHPGCFECQKQLCLSCNTTALFNPELRNNKCECMDGTFLMSGGNQCDICNKTLMGCVRCVDGETCEVCDEKGEFVEDGSGGCKCQVNFTLVGERCLECSKMVGCTFCVSTEQCTQCDTDGGFWLNQETNRCECVENSILQGQQCVPCYSIIQFCVTCQQAPPSALSSSKDHSPNHISSQPLTISCTTCKPNFLYNATTNTCDCPSSGFQLIETTCRQIKPSDSEGVPTHWVLIAVIEGGVILVGAVVFLVVRYLRRKRKEARREKRERAAGYRVEQGEADRQQEEEDEDDYEEDEEEEEKPEELKSKNNLFPSSRRKGNSTKSRSIKKK